MTDSAETDRSTSAAQRPPVVDELDELLGSAVVYEHGTSPPVEEPAFVMPAEVRVSQRSGSARDLTEESKVSPLFWAAAVVWSLPGGIGGWLILRKTHPRTARKVLLVGVISFAVLVAIISAVVATQRTLYPNYFYIDG